MAGKAFEGVVAGVRLGEGEKRKISETRRPEDLT
jgi:hypothetical protein